MAPWVEGMEITMQKVTVKSVHTHTHSPPATQLHCKGVIATFVDVSHILLGFNGELPHPFLYPFSSPHWGGTEAPASTAFICLTFLQEVELAGLSDISPPPPLFP